MPGMSIGLTDGLERAAEMNITGLILAAGLSRRMGTFKPLLKIGDKTLLELSVRSLLQGGASRVVVVLGYRAQEVAAMLRMAYPTQVLLAFNPDYDTTDMLRSIQIGFRAMPPGGDACLLLPGDMPAVSPSTMRLLAEAMRATGAKVVFPTLNGHRKHPPLISLACAGDIIAYRGESGLRGLWAQYEGMLAEVPVTDEGCLMDADTAEDFSRLEAFMTRREARV